MADFSLLCATPGQSEDDAIRQELLWQQQLLERDKVGGKLACRGFIEMYRVTVQVMSNLQLTSKQKFRFKNYGELIVKRNLFLVSAGRFDTFGFTQPD